MSTTATQTATETDWLCCTVCRVTTVHTTENDETRCDDCGHLNEDQS